MNLLVSIPEVPQGSKVCGKCERIKEWGYGPRGALLANCGVFGHRIGCRWPKRSAACLAAEEAARQLEDK